MSLTRSIFALIGIGLAAMIIAVDYSIVNTCLGAIGADLHTPVARLSWLMSAFGIGFCSLVVPFGRFADLIGRRKVLFTTVIIFALSSLGAGMAQHFNFLLAMRIVQGISGAAILPTGTAMVADAFDEQYRARALGAYGSLLGIGLALGPVIGSFILATSSWRWVFWINIPIAIISLLICASASQESRSSEQIKIDWLGAVLLVGSLALLTLYINLGASLAWFSNSMLSTLSVTIVAFIAFIYWQSVTSAPLLPLKFMKKPSVLIGIFNAASTISPGWVVMFLMPLYLFSMLHLSAIGVGSMVFIMTAMTVIAPIIAGWIIEKVSANLAMYLSFVFAIVGLALMCFLHAQGPMWFIVLSFVVFGIGWGAGNGTAIPCAVTGENDTDNAGLITGILLTLVNLIAVIMLSISSTVFSRVEQWNLSQSLAQHGVNLTDVQLVKLKSLLAQPSDMFAYLHQVSHAISTDHIKSLFNHAFMLGQMEALLTVTLICAGFCIFALVLMFRRQHQRKILS